MSINNVRVRFAPSPTGPLHIGGVRTALYNYLFARKHGGTMILRVEDTDETRFVEGAQEYIIDAFKWCGIEFDESPEKGGNYGPYIQSQRKDIYSEYAEKLVESGNAYYAFDTAEELTKFRSEAEANKETFTYSSANRKSLNNSENIGIEAAKERIANGEVYVLRFKTPENEELVMHDIVRGEVRVQTSTLDDKVLFKSSGMPTYHLANIIDDHLMEISHVIRGEEWLPSMPLHIMLYRAFGWNAPEFAHLPLLLKPTGNGKLSKRDGDKLGFPVFPTQWINPEGEKSMGYREEGYFADAFINMLALLGWNAGTEQEIFSMEELIEAFSLERVNKSGARFDPEKAKWFNHQYMINNSDEFIAEEFAKILDNKGISYKNLPLAKIVSLVKDRANFTNDIYDQSYFFFETPTEYDAKTVKKRWKEDAPIMMADLKTILQNVQDFSSENTETVVKAWIEAKELPMGKVMNAFRLSIVGAGKGPHMFDIISIIGKDETLLRLQNAIDNIKR
ncbi:MAG: glutamate--tRNA ligase [Bacteroidetes bacterium 4572_112]|nr:MAG: glutamate--tRNA ligase [Bacteroidetes bacterium 4572_112]